MELITEYFDVSLKIRQDIRQKRLPLKIAKHVEISALYDND